MAPDNGRRPPRSFFARGGVITTIEREIRPFDAESDVRRAVREANRLAGVLQGTMSLESQGLDGRKLHQIKLQMVHRLLRAN
jgi:hypothetical protein